jgi:hypothetical protein
VTRRTRERQANAYTIAELPDLYNTQHIDLWWNWMWRDASWANPMLYRYVLPELVPVWCIDENQRDMLAEAFAMGSFLAITTQDMTGTLLEAPELAAQVRRLAKLRQETAPFVSHGQFLDNRGEKVEGGKGYVYASEHGLAVTLANGSPTRKTLQVSVDLSFFPRLEAAQWLLFVEGKKPRAIAPVTTNGHLAFRFSLPGYAAGVLILKFKKEI